MFEQIGSALARGHRIELRGFGVFSLRMHRARVGRNPRTGDQVVVQDRGAPRFKTDKELWDRLNLLDRQLQQDGVCPCLPGFGRRQLNRRPRQGEREHGRRGVRSSLITT